MKWRKKYEPKHWNKKVKVYFQSEIVVASLKSLLSFRVLLAEITCKYFTCILPELNSNPNPHYWTMEGNGKKHVGMDNKIIFLGSQTLLIKLQSSIFWAINQSGFGGSISF